VTKFDEVTESLSDIRYMTADRAATMRDLVLAVAQSPAFNDRTEVKP